MFFIYNGMHYKRNLMLLQMLTLRDFIRKTGSLKILIKQEGTFTTSQKNRKSMMSYYRYFPYELSLIAIVSEHETVV